MDLSGKNVYVFSISNMQYKNMTAAAEFAIHHIKNANFIISIMMCEPEIRLEPFYQTSAAILHVLYVENEHRLVPK